MQFTPNENFSDPDLKSEYLVGLSYTVKDYVDPATGKVVKAQDCLLFTKVKEWLAAGKVRLGGAAESDIESHFAGSGEVK